MNLARPTLHPILAIISCVELQYPEININIFHLERRLEQEKYKCMIVLDCTERQQISHFLSALVFFNVYTMAHDTTCDQDDESRNRNSAN